VGQAGVAGWDEGIKGACPGEIRRVTIPPHLGYGEKGIEGTVPPNTTIILEMDIIKIEDRVLSFLDRISSGNFGRGK
jgi:FK506-binding protein 2